MWVRQEASDFMGKTGPHRMHLSFLMALRAVIKDARNLPTETAGIETPTHIITFDVPRRRARKVERKADVVDD